MAEQSADAQWELAGATRMGRTAKGWALVGGSEDDGSVSLHVVVFHPHTDGVIQRRVVRVPLAVEEEELKVGEVEVA